METEKPGFSDDGDHHRDPEKMEDTVEPSSRRSYECVFCKRGFTNAQALGGHMNIHRKDRTSKSSSSSKHALNPTISNPNPNPNPRPASVTGPFSFEKCDGTDSWDPTKYLNSSYPIIVHSSSSNIGRTPGLEGKLGSDLSLQIGSSCPVNISDEEREDIDLELRLGRGDP